MECQTYEYKYIVLETITQNNRIGTSGSMKSHGIDAILVVTNVKTFHYRRKYGLIQKFIDYTLYIYLNATIILNASYVFVNT